MIYTVGRTNEYRQYQQACKNDGDTFAKAAGGSVWEQAEDAKNYLRSVGLDNYSVWRVQAEWEKDTDVGTEHFRQLNKDAEMVEEVQ